MKPSTIIHYIDSFTIARGPGERVSESYWGDNPVTKTLPDDGAKICFNTYKTSNSSAILNIDFSYVGQSSRVFSRSLDISLENTIELVQFLNNIILEIAKESEYFYYLAYGTDIVNERILKQAPSAVKIQNIRLNNYKLEFNKRNKDGSVTANIEQNYNWYNFNSPTVVYCVLYKIKNVDKAKIEIAERNGNGYIEKELLISLENGGKVNAITYVADQAYLISDVLPSDFYIDQIVKGALENEFPEEYIKWLKEQQSI